MVPNIPPTSERAADSARNCNKIFAVLVSADSHPQPDLPSTFGDAHQHDIHDSNATDQERYSGNGREQQRQGRCRGGNCVCNVGQVAESTESESRCYSLVSPPERRQK